MSVPVLSDAQKLIAQLFLARVVITEEELSKSVQKIVDSVGTENDKSTPLPETIQFISNALNTGVKFKIVHIFSELDGKAYYGLEDDNVYDETDTFASYQLLPLKGSFTEKEVDYFNQIIEKLIDGKVNSKQMLLCGDDKKLSASQKQAFLKRLVDGLWLIKTENEYFIGPRTQISLHNHIAHILGNDDGSLPRCSFCKNETIVFRHCENCEHPIHYYCFSQTTFCPHCQKRWQLTEETDGQ